MLGLSLERANQVAPAFSNDIRHISRNKKARPPGTGCAALPPLLSTRSLRGRRNPVDLSFGGRAIGLPSPCAVSL